MTLSELNKSFFALLILLCVCGAITAHNQSNPDIRGTITKLSRPDSQSRSGKLPGSILVERDRNGSGGHDKADLKITNETRIFAQADKEKRTPLQIDALKLNQRVEVRFTSAPALLTYPIQVGAAEIIILSGSFGSSQNSGILLPNATTQDSESEMTKVRRAIDAGNAVWVEAWAKGNATMLPDTFTTDGKELVAGGKVYKGHKQILALMRDSMQKRGGRAKLTVTTTDVWLDGNTAYETGTAVYEFTVDNRPQTLERRYFTIWKRPSKRGAWKIYSNTGVAKE
ncbi:MAG TPA: nuclear transport factor 2 family protein [Pyrinomonadaceae bacterium]|jgi:uncharacterized protein (TIGR02246 family)